MRGCKGCGSTKLSGQVREWRFYFISCHCIITWSDRRSILNVAAFSVKGSKSSQQEHFRTLCLQLQMLLDELTSRNWVFFFCLFFSFRCTYVELSLSSILRSEHFGSSIVKFTRYWRPFSCASSISTWIHLAIHNWLRFTAGTTRLMPHFVVDQCTFYPQEFLAQQEPIKYKGPLWYNCNARHP